MCPTTGGPAASTTSPPSWTAWWAWGTVKESFQELYCQAQGREGKTPLRLHMVFMGSPGMASRIGFTFHFRDYTTRELTDIFLSKMQKYGYLLAQGAAEQVEKPMEYFHVPSDFGNGRFVDNAIDLRAGGRPARRHEPDRAPADEPHLRGPGGAERVVFGTHTTGCASDCDTAKRTARSMLEDFSMGPEQGARTSPPC